LHHSILYATTNPGKIFESLFYIPKWKLVLGEVHQMPIEQRQKLLTHRELAVTKAVPRIKELLSG
jgi:hypothetical protein